MSETSTGRFRDEVARRASDAQALLELLAEEHPAYAGQSSAEVTARRGWVLCALGRGAVPAQALPYLLEELQSGHSPYLMAAAARALRQCPAPPAAARDALARAAGFLALQDDALDLDQWGGAADHVDAPGALDEVARTQCWLQAAGDAAGADCCGLPLPWTPRGGRARLDAVRFEDQDGASWSWRQLFRGKPTIVAFFYTRCDNERKCPLTIARLAQTYALLRQTGLDGKVRVHAITYDPDYDLPPRLRAYAHNRQLPTGADCRLLRATAGRAQLARHFASGVNYSASTVNRHRIEVFLLDANGNIHASCQRLEWQPGELVARAAALPATPTPATLAAAAPMLWGVALALLPKCPICGVTYLSVSGIAAYAYLPGWSRAWPALLLMLLLNIGALAWLGRGRRQWWPLALAAAGTLLLAIPGLAMGLDWAMAAGAAGVAAASLLAVRTMRRRPPPAALLHGS